MLTPLLPAAREEGEAGPGSAIDVLTPPPINAGITSIHPRALQQRELHTQHSLIYLGPLAEGMICWVQSQVPAKGKYADACCPTCACPVNLDRVFTWWQQDPVT